MRLGNKTITCSFYKNYPVSPLVLGLFLTKPRDNDWFSNHWLLTFTFIRYIFTIEIYNDNTEDFEPVETDQPNP